MVESCVGPSELHLKKELTSLQRARFLRDPETCSSWRSPLSSKSFILTPRINNDNGIRRIPVGQSKSGASLEEHPRCETRKNEAYLCNWRHKSTVAGGSKELLDDDEKEGSVEGNQGNLNNSCTVDKNYTSIRFPLDIDHIADANSKNPIRRTVRKSRRRKGIVKHFAVSKFLDTASNSQILNSGQQSDDTENCGSEDLRQFTHHLSQKIGYASPSASPLFSGSGCGNWSLSSRTLKIQQRDESSQSCTPASANSYHKSGIRNPSTVSSWDETADSFDEDVLNQPELTSGQGCGIPCYWSKRTRNRGYGVSCSPSLSDTLKRKGSSILCGSQALYGNKKRSGYHKQKYVSKSSQGLPLLTNDFDEGGLSGDTASDELSANFGELDLEALSRLDGRRWSSCKSVEGKEIVRPGVVDLETADQRSLSQKYKPMSFDEIVGQNIVVQSLKNAIFRGRIAPAYLFQGPRGTGKTSIAQIFAAALNCLSDAENKPCWLCRECTTFSDRRMSKLKEVDATNKKDIDEVRYMLKNLSPAKRTVKYRIFVIEECHMLSLKIWSLFSKFLEEPFPGVVFIFVTVDPENLPCAITSRCQKYILSKIKDIDIVCRLRKLCAQENFDVNLDALDLIALNSDGSLRDAETMLDQLSLLGRKITTSLVNDLVGVVSDEKLLDLLEIAMSSDTAETVKRSREIMDSGVDPIALMSQLAGLIMDIIAGTYRLAKSRGYATALGGPSLTEAELERLQQSLKILSDAEKQLRLSSERSTWFTAALLQLGSGQNTESSHSTGSIRSKQSNNKTSHRECNISNSSTMCSDRKSLSRNLADCDQVNDDTKKKVFKCLSPQKLDKIWIQCVDRCHSKTLKQLLSCHGRLASITESEGVLIAFVVFEDSNIKSRAERFLSSITNSIEMVLGHNVEVKIGLVSEYCIDRLKSTSEPSFHNPLENYNNKKDVCDSSKKKKDVCNSQGSHSKRGRFEGTPNMSRKSMDSSKEMLEKTQEQSDNFTNAEKSCIGILSRGHCDMCNSQENAQLASAEMSQRTEINEQRLESAWLQDAEKHVPGSMSHVKPEKNQVMPQCDSHQSFTALSMPSNHWEDELSHEVKALKIDGHEVQYDNKVGGGDNFTISPSLLHSNSRAIIDKDNLGYESGPGCNGLFCWKSNKDHGQKIKQGRNVGSRKRNRLSLFGQCTKLKETELK